MNGDITIERLTMNESVDVFAELFTLLEDYGPTWYTEELHSRAEVALQVLQDLKK